MLWECDSVDIFWLPSSSSSSLSSSLLLLPPPPSPPPHILQAINNEEELLEWEMTPFPQMQMILQLSEPYQRLWKTAFNFHEKNEKWMNGEIATEIA